LEILEEEGTDLLVLDSKEIVDHAAVENIRNAERLSQEQFQAFIKERLIERTKAIDDVIHCNKLKLFNNIAKKNVGKAKLQVSLLKSDIKLFSRLYIGCQTREGSLEEFFCHENQPYPPFLSGGDGLNLGTKSDLLACLQDASDSQCDALLVGAIIIDGAVIVQMLKPATVKNFDQYASQIFVPFILSQFQKVSRIDLAWDRYIENTLKSAAIEQNVARECISVWFQRLPYQVIGMIFSV